MSPPTPTSIMLVNGRYFDHLAPDPSVLDLDVLEHGLQAPRFNNQTIRPISIAEHSLRVARITRRLCSSGRTDRPVPAYSIWALMHDAHEALVPWGDCLGPGKTPEMKAIEFDVDEAIIAAFGIDKFARRNGHCDEWIEITDVVKIADAIALYFEAMLWQPGAIDWAPDVLGHIGYGPNPDKWLPLIAPRSGESWRAEVEALIGGQS